MHLKTDMADKNLKFWTTQSNVFFVATSVSSDKVLGIICYKHINSTTVEMHRCNVDSEFRGLGIGRKLVQKLVDTARENGYETMYLTTSTPQVNAIKMYEKMHFKFLRYSDWDVGNYFGIFTGLKILLFTQRL